MTRITIPSLMTLLLTLYSIAPLFSQNLDLAWAQRMGSPNMEEAHSLAVDGDGNVYTTGWFSGPATFGSGSPVFTGAGIFITKFDAAGNYVWAKTIGNSTDDRGRDITVDRNGNVYVTGFFQNTVDFDPGSGTYNLTSSGSDDIYALKLDTDGNFLWANKAGGNSGFQEFGMGITTDTANNAYICGFFAVAAAFDTINLSVMGGNIDAFVAKLDTSGHFVWAKVMGGPDIGSNRAWGIGADTSGHIYVTGGFGASLSLGSLSLTSNGGVDIFITKLNTDGNFIWAKNMGGSGWDFGNSLAVDPAGNVYSTGYFASATDFDPGPAIYTLPIQGTGSDIYISKLNTDGDFVWANRIGGRQSESGGWGIAVDAFSNVFLASRIRDTVITYNQNRDTIAGVTTHGGYDILLAKLNAAGQFEWVTNIGSPGPSIGTDEAAYGIAVGSSGSVYATGIFNGPNVDFDPSPLAADTFFLSNDNSWDMFIMKLSCPADSTSLTMTTNCHGYTINNVVYNTTGIHHALLHNLNGCDSVITLDLTVMGPEPIITVQVDTLSTTQPYAAYQWFKNGVLIPGATQRKFTVSENADYQVFVTDTDGCSDTSEVYTVTNHGNGTNIDDPEYLSGALKVYPNPAHHTVNIKSPAMLSFTVTSIEGKTILPLSYNTRFSVASWPAGLYFLHIYDRLGKPVKVAKLVVDQTGQ